MRYREGQTPRTNASGTSPRHCGTRTRTLPFPMPSQGQVRQALDNLRVKRGVTVPDHWLTRRRAADWPRPKALTGTLVAVEARAHRSHWKCAEKSWNSPASAIESDGRRGLPPALRQTKTAQGRTLIVASKWNLWYDDPLQELSDEPQLCRTMSTKRWTGFTIPPGEAFHPSSSRMGQPIIPPATWQAYVTH